MENSKYPIPEVGTVCDFFDDGKIQESRLEKMRVEKIVCGLRSLKELPFWDEKNRAVTGFDEWTKSVRRDMDSFARVGYRIFDWGCEDFIVCSPRKEDGTFDGDWSVIFAKAAGGGWYSLDDARYNGRLDPENMMLGGVEEA